MQTDWPAVQNFPVLVPVPSTDRPTFRGRFPGQDRAVPGHALARRDGSRLGAGVSPSKNTKWPSHMETATWKRPLCFPASRGPGRFAGFLVVESNGLANVRRLS